MLHYQCDRNITDFDDFGTIRKSELLNGTKILNIRYVLITVAMQNVPVLSFAFDIAYDHEGAEKTKTDVTTTRINAKIRVRR